MNVSIDPAEFRSVIDEAVSRALAARDARKPDTVEPPAEKLLFSIPETAEALGASPSAVAQWVRKGLIQKVKLGTLTKIHRTEVERTASEGLADYLTRLGRETAKSNDPTA